MVSSQELIGLAKTGNDEARLAAMIALGNFGKRIASLAPEIIPHLGSNEPIELHLRAIRLLGQIGVGNDVAKRLARLTSDEFLGDAAIEALGDLGEDAAPFAANLVPYIETNYNTKTASAIWALGKMGINDTNISRFLIRLLDEGGIDPPYGEGDFSSQISGTLGAMLKRDSALKQELLQLLDETNSTTVRCRVIWAFEESGERDKDIFESFIKLAETKDPRTFSSAASALGQAASSQQQIIPMLSSLLKSSDPRKRAFGAEAVCWMGTNGAALGEIIVPLLNDVDLLVSVRAIEAIGKMGDSGARFAKALIPIIRNHDDNWGGNPKNERCRFAISALSKLGLSAAANGREILALCDHPTLGSEAIRALGEMGTNAAPYADDLSKRLLELGADLYNENIASALGEMGTAASPFVDRLIPLLKPNNARDPGYSNLPDVVAHAIASIARGRTEIGRKILTMRKKERLPIAVLEAVDEIGIGAGDWNAMAEALSIVYSLPSDDVAEFRFRLYLWAGRDNSLLDAVKWLGRPEAEMTGYPTLTRSNVAHLLRVFVSLWDSAKEKPELQRELSQRIGYITKRVSWLPDDETNELLTILSRRLNSDAFAVDRDAVLGALARRHNLETGRRFLFCVGLHFACWSLLLFVYPRYRIVQTFCFWNPWFRKFLGFPYVGLVLRWVPVARKRLFTPFVDILVADAQLWKLRDEHWFAESRASDLSSDGKSQPLSELLPGMRGQIVIVGESGLGKTMFLRKLVEQAVNQGRVIAFLPAEECADGVLEALQKRLEGPAKDAAFLRDLIYAGVLDVCIDGLNQVSPEQRGKIVDFMDRFVHGNVIVTTQPIAWRTPKLARIIHLEPLFENQILAFMESRAVCPNSIHMGDKFLTACRKWLANIKTSDNASIRKILSNPLDLTVAAELIATGKQPDILDMQGQQYHMMSAQYREECGKDFPLERVAEAAYEMRLKGKQEFPVKAFQLEARYLATHRLLLCRQSANGAGSTLEWWVFRHDKFLEFFVVHAFRGGNRKRRMEHMGDSRFTGVYLRLAIVLPLSDAEELREQFIDYAAESGDHSTSDEYIRAIKRRRSTSS
jgi:HEAT repeat protein